MVHCLISDFFKRHLVLLLLNATLALQRLPSWFGFSFSFFSIFSFGLLTAHFSDSGAGYRRSFAQNLSNWVQTNQPIIFEFAKVKYNLFKLSFYISKLTSWFLTVKLAELWNRFFKVEGVVFHSRKSLVNLHIYERNIMKKILGLYFNFCIWRNCVYVCGGEAKVYIEMSSSVDLYLIFRTASHFILNSVRLPCHWVTWNIPVFITDTFCCSWMCFIGARVKTQVFMLVWQELNPLILVPLK